MAQAAPQKGGVDRTHASSTRSKLVFAACHGALVVLCCWLAFGSINWPDPLRAKLMAACAALYFARHLITLFLLLQRKVDMSEVWGLVAFIAVFEVGFLFLGGGLLSGNATPLGWLDWVGAALLVVGSLLNTGSEMQRWRWKNRPTSKGRCYTGGLFAYSTHINYFGDTVLFIGWALLTASVLALSIPVLMTAMFVFFHIPALDRYLSARYGTEFDTYAKRTAKLVPFIY